MSFFSLHTRRLAALVLALGVSLTACDSEVEPEPVDDAGTFFVATYLDAGGPLTGSSFFQAAALEDGTTLTNANAFETTPFAYTFVRGNDVVVTSHYFGDQVVRYTRPPGGGLVEAGRFSAPAGSGAFNVVWASDTKAYLTLHLAGKVLVFNPQTMAATGEIDLTTLGIARNPANPEDRNPDPAVMAIRDGKLYVSLWQTTTSFFSAEGTDLAVFDVATDAFERVISDPRMTTPGRPGYNESMVVDEAGDLYVHGIASFGFVPGQRTGWLRVRRGATAFDPTYFFDLTALQTSLPGGRVTYLAGMQYAGGGDVYGQIEVPGLFSNPPDYVRDRNYQPVRLNLQRQTLDVLPLPAGNGYSAAVALDGDRVLFGLTANAGTGIYAYDRRTSQGTPEPVVRTVGGPSRIVAFEN